MVLIALVCCITVLLVPACTPSPHDQGPGKTPADSGKSVPVQAKPLFIKPPSSSDDTVFIADDAAVFFNADSVQLKKVKEITDTGFYESITHEGFYQQRNARMVVKKFYPSVHIYEVVKARYLLFVRKDKSTYCVDLNTKNDLCGIILFNRKKDPQLIDMMTVETQLHYYFDE